MSNEQILSLAKEAAMSAYFDVSTVIGEVPSAEDAYDFIRNCRYEEFDGDDVDAQKLWDDLTLSAQDMILFRAQYATSCAEFAAVTKATAEKQEVSL